MNIHLEPFLPYKINLPYVQSSSKSYKLNRSISILKWENEGLKKISNLPTEIQRMEDLRLNSRFSHYKGYDLSYYHIFSLPKIILYSCYL